MIRFAGKKMDLSEFLDYLELTYGSEKCISDLPNIVCGSDGHSTQGESQDPVSPKRTTETLVV